MASRRPVVAAGLIGRGGGGRVARREERAREKRELRRERERERESEREERDKNLTLSKLSFCPSRVSVYMHGGDNGTERNEVSVYSAPPNLGCLNTAAQLPIMRLGGESEPTRQHYWSQMGEQNRYNAAGVNDEEAYLDSGFSRSDWNPKITVEQIFSSKKALLTELPLKALRGHFEFKIAIII
ncbi:NB-ARC domain-containing disease resistance protein [Prunus dulcis]|uniref:NB-ARC domain-containing disease resistance protein n=1 Tax=Prunus dulcis TaxID=3755 RepID=A0A5H2XY12_PRUDU|nr:NB-ARC domain-containing disease resistance protein [Prunus dulcis]